MPRIERIEYDGAYYHVMNRGRGQQTIFHDEEYFQAFLVALEEAHHRFGAVIHAYCLMSNHYHLLIETPHGNISRIMRHVNGVYTQRYNRLRKTDGPLFRGRFKSIVVDSDAYLLQLSRYIHRNPVEVRRAFTTLDDYPWSSYRGYINLEPPKKWLNREQTYKMLGSRYKYQGYKAFVEEGIDEELKRFYNKGNIARVLGDAAFKEEVLEQKELHNKEFLSILTERPNMDEICRTVAKMYRVELKSIIGGFDKRIRQNQPRKVAMYLCQLFGDEKLKDIAEYFSLQGVGSVCSAISEMKRLHGEGELDKAINQMGKRLNIKQYS